MSFNSNERISIWVGIEADILKRIAENTVRINTCTDEELMPVHIRIMADDHRRLRAAREWVDHHKRSPSL